MTFKGIKIYNEEDVAKLSELPKIESKECTDLFFVIFDSAYKLSNFGEIYREIYPLSDDVKRIIESKMYEELLFLLDALRKFIDICDVPQEILDKINEIIENFGNLEYINLMANSVNLIVILYQILFRFYGNRAHSWTIKLR
jgi:hypothetical protein